MNKDFVSFPITGMHRLKEQMLNWASRFNICSFLDNHRYHFGPRAYECLAGIGALHTVSAPAGNALHGLDRFRAQHTGWLFGHLGYGLEEETVGASRPAFDPSTILRQAQDDIAERAKPGTGSEGGEAREPGAGLHDNVGPEPGRIVQQHPDLIAFPDLFFFVPEIVLLLSDTTLAIASYGSMSAEEVFAAIRSVVLPGGSGHNIPVDIKSRFSRKDYIDTVERLRSHILRGDCYEVNFCQEFFAEGAKIDPLAVYQSLSLASPNPFGAYYRLDDKYLLCASPERYLKKEGDRILSQPIKGTWERNTASPEQDEHNRRQLQQSPKDRSENVMVVDLVRNDLSRVCREGTVKVDELFGIYSFPQVHQMISTVSGQLKEDAGFADIIRASFPMGSMTGAPKKRVLELIRQYERSRRGLFSGAVGYITPAGDFDFNVVIRSILYNQANHYLSYQAGSAITFYSNAEQEYEECLLKAGAIQKVLTGLSSQRT